MTAHDYPTQVVDRTMTTRLS